MPVQKYSAMDPGGSWNMDARDQVAMWNANRGDQINMWQQNRLDQRGQDDWRREVALKQLGLTEKGMNWNREDSAAERAAKYGFMGEELGLRREESAADRALRERGFVLQERGMNLQFSEAERLAKQRADEEAALSGLDPAAMGVDAGVYKALPGSAKSQFAMQALLRQMERAQRPEDRQMRREDMRDVAAEEAAARLEAGRFTGEREASLLKSQAARGGIKDYAVGRGQMQSAAAVMAQPEFGQAVEVLRAQLRNIPDVYKIGGKEGEAVGQILSQAIDSQAAELARQFGTDPRQLAQLLYSEVSKGSPGQRSGFLAGLGRAIVEVPTLGFAETQNEAAQRLLAERFAQ